METYIFSVGTVRIEEVSMLVMTSGSEEYWVISVPAEGSVTSSVSSVVHMVGGSGVGGGVGVTAGSLGVCLSPIGEGAQLETVLLVLQLSGLAHQAGHSVDGQRLTHQS